MTARMTETVALAAIVAGATGIGATAYATEGGYGRVDAGYSFDSEADFGAVGTFNSDDGDWVEALGLGYAFSNGLRLEGEFSHRYTALEPLAGALDEGDVHAWSAMGNLYYDFNKGGVVQPYVGVGAGVSQLSVSTYEAGAPAIFRDNDTAFAYQGLVGVAFQVSDSLALDLGYRYFTANGGKFSGTVGGLPTSRGMDYTDQAATVGIRWQFGQHEEAAPPPPPPPPPVEYTPPPEPPPVAVACPTVEFVIYFEWDRSNVNDAAFESIDGALNRARECNLGDVIIVGHTDTSGAAEYNRGLSERRASAVRDGMVARGLSPFSVRTEGRGETDLSRPTRDGVREPLNRRATVTMTFR